MKAAIYARKSTKDDDVADEAKSVLRQETDAREFISARGWSLNDAHVYTDPKKSGALFLGRPAFQRMLRDAASAAFDCVVLFDLDRFGRHGQKSMEALNALADAGVDVYDCSTGQAVDLDSFEGETSTYLKTRFAQQFRDQIRKHTRAAMWRKAGQGHVTGGRVFGYDNVRIAKGHAELQINETEAAVVREIFERAARGEGARTIAAALNRAGVPAPRAQQGRPSGWSQSTVRAVLRRSLYRGEIVYGRTKKAYGRELKKVNRHDEREYGQVRRPEDTWIRVQAPALRIVDPEIVARVDRRLNDRRARYLASLEQPVRRPETAHGKYLLSGGMLICPTCGANFEALKSPWKADGVYVCSTRRRKPGMCRNEVTLGIAHADTVVLDMIEGEILGTRYIDELLALVHATPDPTAHLTAERNRLQHEIDNLVESIAAGVPAATVAPKIREREREVASLEAQLRAPRPEAVDRERLRAALEQRTEAWRQELRAEPRVARLLLRRLIDPIVLHEETTEGRERLIEWEAKPIPEGMLDGLYNMLASPTGFEPVFWP